MYLGYFLIYNHVKSFKGNCSLATQPEYMIWKLWALAAHAAYMLLSIQ